MESKITHFLYCPFTGLGLYGGFRGNRWLRNRIRVFNHFVLPSLKAQTSKNFILWCSWRPEEKNNQYVKMFVSYLKANEEYLGFETVHTFHGICFWDDKYSNEVARSRLLTSLRSTMGELVDYVGDVDNVLMTIQPSDDCYCKNFIQLVQKSFEDLSEIQAIGFEKGYICNYLNKEIAEYNPTTNPPFYTIKFPKSTFINPLEHAQYTALKKDVDQYKIGTPLPSHEYVGDCLKLGIVKERGFLVGTHNENISTTFTHPFKGQLVSKEILRDFGLYDVEKIEIKTSWRRRVLRHLPHKVQRKFRYWFGEIIWNKVYAFLRS